MTGLGTVLPSALDRPEDEVATLISLAAAYTAEERRRKDRVVRSLFEVQLPRKEHRESLRETHRWKLNLK